MVKTFNLPVSVNIYDETCLESLKLSSKVAKGIMKQLCSFAAPGVTTRQLENLASTLIDEVGCEPLFKGYKKFPFCTCMSLNEHIVHGLATDQPLQEGDVLSIDLGLKYKGFCSDHARTLIIGSTEASPHAELIKIAEDAFQAGLQQAYPGKTTGDIGYAINKTVMSKLNVEGDWRSGFKFQICPSFQGHGIGHTLHEGPPVPNFGIKGKGVTLRPGMCICIEPVVLYKKSKVVEYLHDGIKQFKTDNGLPSAHYENQVYIGDDGPIVLTL
jgi:methionyl aminopeptidase